MKMTDKQDRCGVRTASEIERKYRIGKNISEAQDTANDARQTAQRAAAGVDGLDEKLDQDEVYRRLTNNGEWQGIYKGDDGELYINATFVVSGILKSHDGYSFVIDLDRGTADLTGTIRSRVETDEEGKQNFSTFASYGVDCSRNDSDISQNTTLRGGELTLFTSNGQYLKLDSRNISIFSTGDLPDGYVQIGVDPDGNSTNASIQLLAGENMLQIMATPNGTSIVGLSEPTVGTMAVNKAYVDALENRIAALEAMLANS